MSDRAQAAWSGARGFEVVCIRSRERMREHRIPAPRRPSTNHEEADVGRVRDHVIYQGGDVLLLRAAARPLDSACAPWPDPVDSEQFGPGW